MTPHQEIRALLQIFQDGYTSRDLTQVDSFMELFTADAEVIGTNGIKPRVDEWYMDRVSARELVAGDWKTWGDLRLDLDSISIHSRGEVGWVAAAATVTKIIGGEEFVWALRFTAVVVREAGSWKFAQMNFSFPTIYLPDVRLIE